MRVARERVYFVPARVLAASLIRLRAAGHVTNFLVGENTHVRLQVCNRISSQSASLSGSLQVEDVGARSIQRVPRIPGGQMAVGARNRSPRPLMDRRSESSPIVGNGWHGGRSNESWGGRHDIRRPNLDAPGPCDRRRDRLGHYISLKENAARAGPTALTASP